MTLDEQCTAALKRLKTGVAISAGMHAAQIRKEAERARLRMLARWNAEDAPAVRVTLPDTHWAAIGRLVADEIRARHSRGLAA